MCSKQLGEFFGVLDPLKHVIVDHSNDRQCRKYCNTGLHLISQAMTLDFYFLDLLISELQYMYSSCFVYCLYFCHQFSIP